MTAKEVYKIWAPTGKKWVEWVRPVPFLGIGQHSKTYVLPNMPLPKVVFLEEEQHKSVLDIILGPFPEPNLEKTAIIVDLPGQESVGYGVALVDYGFRPIPVYNGTLEQQGSRATVDNQSVGVALELMAGTILNKDIADGARPAFLLDRSRLNRYKLEESMYDNSWDIYPQDLPSPQCFLDNGIESILVIGGKKISRDIKNILVNHQKKGLKIFHTDGYEKPSLRFAWKLPSWD